jgi:hypothetical protein
MPEPLDQSVPTVPEVRRRLQDAAAMLGASSTLDHQLRRTLADLLSELSRALEQPDAPPAEVSRLADGAAQLAEALHHKPESGLLAAARHRVADLMSDAEAHAPVTVGVVQRLIDAIAGLGI